MLEVASELVDLDGWDYKQARIDLRAQGSIDWSVGLFGSDGIDSIAEVVQGRSQFAILNPATAIESGWRRLTGGQGPELRAIATIPSFDQLGLAVAAEVDVKTVEELAQVQPQLVISLRGGRPNHAVHDVIDDTLRAAGLSLSDLVAWGGTLRYEEGLPHQGSRRHAIEAGTVTAIFDEGIYNWVDLATDARMRFLSIGDGTLTALEGQGYRRALLTRGRFPSLTADTPTLDFSGFLIFTRADTSDEMVTAFCQALESRSDRIPWQGGSVLPLERMCSDSADAPLTIPFHAAASAFWADRFGPPEREQG
jgi:hypothetical protein